MSIDASHSHINFNMEVESMAGKDGAVARVNVEIRDGDGGVRKATFGRPERFTVEGYARRDPRDKPNPHIAEELALGRAMQRAGERLEKRSHGMVKHHDDVKAKRRMKDKRTCPPPKKKRRFRRESQEYNVNIQMSNFYFCKTCGWKVQSEVWDKHFIACILASFYFKMYEVDAC